MQPCPVIHDLLQVHMRHTSIIVVLLCALTSGMCNIKPSPATIIHLSPQHPPWSMSQAKTATTPRLPRAEMTSGTAAGSARLLHTHIHTNT